MKNKQTSLFPAVSPNISDIKKLIHQGEFDEVMSTSSLGDFFKLKLIITELWITDWGVLYDCFEENGQMIYCQFSFFGKEITIYDNSSEVYFNNNEILVWNEDMYYDKNTNKKILKAAINFLKNNVTQLMI